MALGFDGYPPKLRGDARSAHRGRRAEHGTTQRYRQRSIDFEIAAMQRVRGDRSLAMKSYVRSRPG